MSTLAAAAQADLARAESRPGARRGLQFALLAGAVLAVAFEVVSSYVNGSPPGPPTPPIYVVTPTLVLVAYLGVGLIAWRRRPLEPVGKLFTLVGYTWWLGSLANLNAAVPFTIGNVVMPFWQPVLGHLGVAWPSGRLRTRTERLVVGANYAWNVTSNVVGTMFWNPQSYGCSGCPRNVLLIDGSTTIHDAIADVGSGIGTLIGLLVLALIVRHWWYARGYQRRTLTALVAVAIPIVAYTTILGLPNNAGLSSFDVYGVGPLVLVAGPAVYGVRLVTAQRARGAVGAALVSLDPASAPDRLRDALARAVGDSALQLAIREAGSDTYLDTRGQRVDPDHPSPGMMVTALKAGDAVIIHDEQLKQEPELIRVTAAAANVALQHARLTAAIEEQLTLVQASRARIVEAGDAERRRLERDLHDGAQQRLVTLSLMLAMLRERSSGGDAELESLIDAASSEAREALIELRELAHGIHPAVLTESGLAGAVEALVERCPVVTTIAAVPAERYPPAVEAAAYFVVSEALANCAKHAQGATATVSIRRQGQRLLLRVDDDGPGGARLDAGSGLRGLADRVAALGGELRVVSRRGHGTHLEAEIPCQ